MVSPHDALAMAVAQAMPGVIERIPAAPAAALGRWERPKREKREKRRRSSKVLVALQQLDKLVVERLFGALELGLATPATAAALEDLTAHVSPPVESFAFVYSDSTSETTLAVGILNQIYPEVTDFIADLVVTLASHDQIAPLLTVDATDEASIAAGHGAVHLGLAVATAAAVLNTLEVPMAQTPAAVIGTALGAVALMLPDLPKPAGYELALLDKRRAEYLYPQSSTQYPLVAEHRFVLAESPATATGDFSENGLVHAIPGGAEIRTAMADGQVQVGMDVLTGPRDIAIDLEVWDEIVEISWTALAGEASLGPRRRSTTPPWPGDYRLRVCARGRDGEEREVYHLAVWAAPAAPEIVHKRTDRLGHRLRGEPEPPVVVLPYGEHRWIEESAFGTAATIAVVTGSSAEEVLRVLGADPASPLPMPDLRLGTGGESWVAISADAETVLVLEPHGYLGLDRLAALSTQRTAASIHWNDTLPTKLSFAAKGTMLESFEPGFDSPEAGPEVTAALAGLDFTHYRHRIAKGMTAVARFTGRGFGQEDLATMETIYRT